MKRKKFTDQELRTIITMYCYKFSMKEIHQKMGMHPNKIYKVIRDRDLHKRLNLSLAA